MSGLLAAARRGRPGLFWFAAAMGALAIVAAVATMLDERMLLGVRIWLKALKFALSFGLYALALAWMLSLVHGRRRGATIVGWVVVATSAIEVGIIVAQVVRGRRSHFNEETPLDAGLFSIMGATVAVIWLATAVLAIMIVRRASPTRR